MLGTTVILSDIVVATIASLNSLGYLDSSIFTEDPSTGEGVVSNRTLKQVKDGMAKDLHDSAHALMSGMQAASLNYIGMVLTGKMDPIYAEEFDEEDLRKETREKIDEVVTMSGVELLKIGALEETSDGRAVLNKETRLFDTVKRSNYGNGNAKSKTK